MNQTRALIGTTFNCVDEIDAALSTFTTHESLALLDEIVIVDGGSTDGTWEALEEWGRRVEKFHPHIAPGANISRGRNEAIKRSSADVLVTFDSGTTYADNWLQLMLAPFDNDEVHVVGGLTVCCGESLFEKAMAGFDHHSRTDRLHGSSHRGIAYRRSVWEYIGGYPEHVEAGEDSWFNTQWREAGYRYVHVPEAQTFWRVRANWKSAFKMMRRNIKGRVGLGHRHRLPRLFGIAAMYMLLVVGAICGFFFSPCGYAVGCLFFCYISLRMFTRGRWRTFVNPIRFLFGLYALSAVDLGSVLGLLEGLPLFLRQRAVGRKAACDD